jgi:hypothetical protein
MSHALEMERRLGEVEPRRLRTLAGCSLEEGILCCRSALHSIGREGIVLVVGPDGLMASTVGMPSLQQLVLEDRWRFWGTRRYSSLIGVLSGRAEVESVKVVLKSRKQTHRGGGD